MSYRYLTRGYVEWLGLPHIPIHKPINRGIVCLPSAGVLAPAGPPLWAEGVEHDGAIYEREPDGLAYTRL